MEPYSAALPLATRDAGHHPGVPPARRPSSFFRSWQPFRSKDTPPKLAKPPIDPPRPLPHLDNQSVSVALDDLDRRLLNEVQSDFPLVQRPFAALAERLETNEDDVLARLREARRSGVIRHLSAIFDVYRIGYRSTLVAMHIDPHRLDEAAAVISAHPGVSHNYGRDHHFNLWFVLAIRHDSDLEAIIHDLALRAGARRTINLPALKLYKIDVEFDMVGGTGRMTRRNGQRTTPRRDLTADEVNLVRVVQSQLELDPEPFAAPAARIGLSAEALLQRMETLRQEGIMRRFAAVLRHREAGFLANGMVCWQVPEERAEEVGAVFSAHPKVSHCYKRPTYEDWPYALFTMVHAHERRECDEVARELSAATGISDFATLYSHTEYKKERVRYFMEESSSGSGSATPSAARDEANPAIAATRTSLP
ncbi:MAG: AsnC family transcriptional regulator [Dehalococcoidia bacterium]|nr:AsnC family transcriptional regulator [Dehalococcoidia bacterium]